MLRQRAQTVVSLILTADMAAIATAFGIAYVTRVTYVPIDGEVAPFSSYMPLLWIGLCAWAVSLQLHGMYESFRVSSLGKEAWVIFRASLSAIVVFSAVIFVFRLDYVSRIFVIVFGVLAPLALVIERWSIRIAARRFRRGGYNYRNIFIVGNGPRAAQLRELVVEKRHWGLRLIEPPAFAPFNSTPPQLGPDLSSFLAKVVVDEAIFALTPSEISQFTQALAACERVGVRAHLCLDTGGSSFAQGTSGDFAGVPVITFQTTPPDGIGLVAKRLLDFLVSVTLLLLLAPVMALIAITVKRTKGPVLFRQTRVGVNGRLFQMYKFRSMVADAETHRTGLEAMNQMSGPVFKIKDDPRLTPIGAFLRKYSLDELPQLWNVVRNEMSLVGPRPPVPDEVSLYQDWQRRRLSVKPGLTGLWQVSGRSEITSFDKWLELDLRYIDNWSLTLDLLILMKTIPAVLSGRGAN